MSKVPPVLATTHFVTLRTPLPFSTISPVLSGMTIWSIVVQFASSSWFSWHRSCCAAFGFCLRPDACVDIASHTCFSHSCGFASLTSRHQDIIRILKCTIEWVSPTGWQQAAQQKISVPWQEWQLLQFLFIKPGGNGDSQSESEDAKTSSQLQLQEEWERGKPCIYRVAESSIQSQPLEISEEKFGGKTAVMKIVLVAFCALAKLATASAQVPGDVIVDASSLQPVAEERSGYVGQKP